MHRNCEEWRIQPQGIFYPVVLYLSSEFNVWISRTFSVDACQKAKTDHHSVHRPGSDSVFYLYRIEDNRERC